MKKQYLFFLPVLLCLVLISIYSEETDVSKRKDIIKYGLESDITELISKLEQENNSDYSSDFLQLFGRTKSPAIKESIVSLFTKQKNPDLKDHALAILEDPFSYKNSMVLAILAYSGELKFTEASPLIRNILSGDNTDYRDRAITALGKIGLSEDAQFLVEYLESDISGDEKQRLIIRQNIMVALGEMKAVECWDKFAAIAADADENAVIRASAATAISKMEKNEAITVLAKLYEETDPIIRIAAISGLARFNTSESVEIILESFKDSYYKVRLEAISASVTLKLNDAVPYILYRAKTDPVENVKMKAFEALGSFNNTEGNKYLLSIFTDEKASDKIKIKAISALSQNSFDSVFSDFEKVVFQALKDDKKTWLRYELGKILIAQKSMRAGGITTAFLVHKDTLTRSIGLDIYEKNNYFEARSAVENIAADEKQGALQRRAKKILGIE